MVIEGTYRVSTLGCRVNRADSLALEKSFARLGYRRAGPGETPEFWVVNTCAVTGEGMRKSRKLVRRCAASGARVMVTGCGADMDEEAFRLPGVESVLGNSSKSRLTDGCPRLDGEAEPWKPFDLVRVPVKVQDGCSRYCSYCIVPYLRPAPSSRPAGDVLEEVRLLREMGTGEVIICGIDLGSYREPGRGTGLEALIAAVLEEAGPMWVRLSSLELSDVTEGLVELLAADNSLCRHLHLPLQSGDAKVIADMGRDYTPGEYVEKVARIREAVPGVNVTTDVLVGFPTEDEAAFEASRALLEEVGFSRVHVFKYSPRPGTAARDLGDPVRPGVKQRRAAELRAVAERMALDFHRRLVGRIMPVLVEAPMEGEPGRLFGRSESFAGVVMPAGSGQVGRRVEVRIVGAEPGFARGEAVRLSAGGVGEV